jgi:hypothetical protein
VKLPIRSCLDAVGKRFAISRTCLVKFDSRFLGRLIVYSDYQQRGRPFSGGMIL